MTTQNPKDQGCSKDQISGMLIGNPVLGGPRAYTSQPWIWLAALCAVSFFFYATKTILLPFVAGAFIAYALNPLTTLLAKRVGRSFATAQSLILFFAFFIFAFLGAIPFVKAEFFELSRTLPLYIEKVYSYLEPWFQKLHGGFQEGVVLEPQMGKSFLSEDSLATLDASVRQNLSSVIRWGLRLLTNIFVNTLALANIVSLVVITPIVAFYLLRDWPVVVTSVNGLLPSKAAPTISDLFSQINKVLGEYARGQVMVCLFLAFYYAVTLSFLGLNYAITIGLLTGFLAFIPYFGFLVGLIAAFGMALSQFDGWIMLGSVGAVFLIGQLLESYLLLPKLIGDKVGLHPVWILFSLLSGGVLFGFLGLLIAMPVAATFGVIVRFVVKAYQESSYVAFSPQKALPEKEKRKND